MPIVVPQPPLGRRQDVKARVEGLVRDHGRLWYRATQATYHAQARRGPINIDGKRGPLRSASNRTRRSRQPPRGPPPSALGGSRVKAGYVPRAESPLPTPALITATEDLGRRLPSAAQQDFVTVDTEFIRERTYWRELCVVQLGGDDEVAVIDALAPGLDLSALGELLADQAVTKVFHAARQDIEIFVGKFGDVPRPLFDTQVAAMVAGFGDQVGYQALVAGLAGGSIDKAHRYSDWSVRPLSPEQIAYAAADVTYLREIYRKLRARLEQDDRLAWVTEEMAVLTDPATYRTDPETMWQRLRTRSTSRRYLGMLRALAAWREQEAQRVNIPRQRLLRDEILLELAATAPTTVEALARTRGLSRGFVEGPMGVGL